MPSRLLNFSKPQAANLFEVYFEYEGFLIFANDNDKKLAKLDDDGVAERFNGSFRTKGSSGTIVDIFHREYPEKNLGRQTVASLHGKQESRFLNDPVGKWSGELRNSYPEEFDISGSYGRIFLFHELLNFLESRRDAFHYERQQFLRGKNLEVISFDLGSEKNPVLKRFWVDVDHNCQVEQSELIVGESLAQRTTCELHEFRNHTGQATWLPVNGQCDNYNEMSAKDRRSYASAPTSTEKMAIVESTVRFSPPSPDDAYKIKFAKGTFITDRNRQSQYEFGLQGRDKKPAATRAESEAKLNQMLTEAQGDVAVLKATAEPSPWFERHQSLILMGFFAVGCVAAILFAVRHFRGRP